MQDDLQSGASGLPSWKGVAAYLVTLVLAVGGYFLIRSIGEVQGSPPAVEVPAVVTQKSHAVDVVFHVLLTLSVMVGLGFVLGRAFRWLGQPPVIGEIVAGICLGPSLLGAVAPRAMELLIPTGAADPQGHVTAALRMIAQLGVVLYMFVVGLELNSHKLKTQIHAAVAISHVSIVVPFLLGALLALGLHGTLAPAGVSFTSFSLFLGVAMAITAFPVLARILTDRGLEKTRIGAVALACAAADDATAWCLLAVVVGIVQTQISDAVRVGALSLAYIAAMLFFVRPWIAKWCQRNDAERGPFPHAALVLGFVGVLLSALATESIGIHAIFGAFLMGVAIPHQSRLAHELKSRLRDAVTILLLPTFFAYTGSRTQIGLVSGLDQWLTCGLIIFVASLGKFGGTLVAARVSGIGWRHGAILGALMNTRGLMELIVLNVGLDLGVITDKLFAMMVLMALATTLATAPLVALLTKDDQHEPSAEEELERAA